MTRSLKLKRGILHMNQHNHNPYDCKQSGEFVRNFMIIIFGVKYQPLITTSLNFRVSHFGTSKMISMIHRPKKQIQWQGIGALNLLVGTLLYIVEFQGYPKLLLLDLVQRLFCRNGLPLPPQATHLPPHFRCPLNHFRLSCLHPKCHQQFIFTDWVSKSSVAAVSAPLNVKILSH